MTNLHISPDLSLPPDAVTSTLVVYGGKGMGKTNLASVLVEELASAGLRFAVIDPMGVWWGLRHAADGKGIGIKVLILGGIHGDLPIEPTSGAVVADLVADEDASVIVDISRRADGSMWSIAERVRFVTAYAKRLYQRQGEKRRPIHQVIDEAARFAPQVVRHGESEVAACIGAIAVIVEEGRNVGIGVTLVTQRSARLNKDVAELADCMIAFRVVGPNSMRAVLDWLGEHVEKARFKELGEKLRSLPRGSALVVSPGWLEFEGIVAIRKRKTFDSSKTPEAGKEVRASGAGAKVDLDKYRARMAEVIERAQENDPKALKARVAELEAKLAKAQQVVEGKITIAKAEAKTVEKPVIKEAQLQRIGVLLEQGDVLIKRWDDASAKAHEAMLVVEKRAGAFFEKLGAQLGDIRNAIASTKPTNREIAAAHFAGDGKVTKLVGKHQIRAYAHDRDASTDPGDPDLTGPERRILEALTWLEGIGQTEPPVEAVAFLADYRPGGGAFNNTRGILRSKGFVTYPSGGTMALTELGRAKAPHVGTPGSGEQLRATVLARLDGPERRVLEPLLEAYPNALTVNELAAASGYGAGGGAFNNTRGRLRTLGLADYPRPGSVRAADLLFPEGA